MEQAVVQEPERLPRSIKTVSIRQPQTLPLLVGEPDHVLDPDRVPDCEVAVDREFGALGLIGA